MIENILQLISTSDDDSHAHSPEIEKESKIVEIPIKKWIFVIPLYLQSYPIFKTVNFVRRRLSRHTINHYLRIKLFLDPTSGVKERIDEFRYLTFSTAPYTDPTFLQSKFM